MPRVVPSQVVQAIDLLFPWAKDQRDAVDDRKSIHVGASNNAAAVLELVENIPNELLVLQPDVYARFLAATSALKNQLITWNSRGNTGNLERVSGFGELNPIAIIRNAVALCSDETPYIETNELNYIDDMGLRNSIWADIGAVRRALINQEWKAATVLAGSTIEALLLWSLSTKAPAEIQTSIRTLIANNTFQRDLPNDNQVWNLYQYIHVCRELDLISEPTKEQALLAKDFRNLIHPGRAIRLEQVCDRGTAYSAVAGVENVIRDLERA